MFILMGTYKVMDWWNIGGQKWRKSNGVSITASFRCEQFEPKIKVPCQKLICVLSKWFPPKNQIIVFFKR